MLWNIHSDPIILNIDLNPATIGNNTLIAGITNTRIFIRGLTISADGACVLTFKSGSTAYGTAKLAANGSFNLSDIAGADGEPFWNLKLGDAFVVTSDAAVRLTGTCNYALFN
jgi:hypothetical protein